MDFLNSYHPYAIIYTNKTTLRGIIMKNYDIAAFIWPSYTGDEPRTRIFWPDGIGEWQTVKAMTDKGYKGCRWPRIPTWGYVNEADSSVMEMQIECAVSHGVNVFIYTTTSITDDQSLVRFWHGGQCNKRDKKCQI